jgi:hypothetical protein
MIDFPNSYEEFPIGTYGYIYETIYIPTNKKYIGKKALIYNVKKKLGKKELNEWKGRGRPPSFKLTEKESDWKTYYGSHEFIKEEIKKGNQSNFTRKILQFAFSKKELTYLENKWLFSKAVLETDEYLNDNILGKFFTHDFQNGG